MSTARIEPADLDALRPFDDVVNSLLASAGLQAQVRLLPWTGPTGRLSVRCHVYAGSTGLFHGSPSWVWWSPVVEAPDELKGALEAALRTRPLVERRSLPRPVGAFPL